MNIPGAIRYSARPQRRHIATVVGLCLGYIALFVVLYPVAKNGVAPIGIVPVLVAGWLLGRAGGLITGLVLNIATTVLFSLVGAEFNLELLFFQALPANIVVPAAGYLVGLLRDLSKQTQAQAHELAAEREHLHQEIASRKRAEIELLLAKDAAEAASRAKTAFIASMSHELRTPLTTIMGYAELLRMHAEEQHESQCIGDLDRILAASYNLRNMINGVLDIANMEAGRLAIEIAPFALPALLADVATAIQPAMLARNNTLKLSIAPEISSMHSDAAKVRQVLFNLLAGAARLTSASKVLLDASIVGDAGGDWVAITVAGAGAGIPPNLVQQLFDEQAQFEIGSLPEHSGVALGLLISRRLCRRLGGDIILASTPKGGAVFTVRLPLVPAAT